MRAQPLNGFRESRATDAVGTRWEALADTAGDRRRLSDVHRRPARCLTVDPHVGWPVGWPGARSVAFRGGRRVGRLSADHSAVQELDYPVAALGDVGVVGGQDDDSAASRDVENGVDDAVLPLSI